jgi:hypothetical protein
MKSKSKTLKKENEFTMSYFYKMKNELKTTEYELQE